MINLDFVSVHSRSSASFVRRYSSNISSGCHLQSSVRKRPAPVSAILTNTLFIIYRIFYSVCGFQGTLSLSVSDQTVIRSFTDRLKLLLLANGDGEIRTLDPLLARQVLSQLSYTPGSLFSSVFYNDYTSKYSHGLKWTRTTDLTLIRRAL